MESIDTLIRQLSNELNTASLNIHESRDYLSIAISRVKEASTKVAESYEQLDGMLERICLNFFLFSIAENLEKIERFSLVDSIYFSCCNNFIALSYLLDNFLYSMQED